MSCRYCRERLSAFLDAELSTEELQQVQAHLDACASCNTEYRALSETKCALASLGARVSREEIERLLQTDVGEAVRRYAAMPVSPRTVAAAILSLVGLWLATTRLTGREDRQGAPLPEGAYLIPVSQESVEMASVGGGLMLSAVEVRSFSRPLIGNQETCMMVPMTASVMGPTALFCGPVPRPVRTSLSMQQALVFTPSFMTH